MVTEDPTAIGAKHMIGPIFSKAAKNDAVGRKGVIFGI
jgi:hypothetical protein